MTNEIPVPISLKDFLSPTTTLEELQYYLDKYLPQGAEFTLHETTDALVATCVFAPEPATFDLDALSAVSELSREKLVQIIPVLTEIGLINQHEELDENGFPRLSVKAQLIQTIAQNPNLIEDDIGFND